MLKRFGQLFLLASAVVIMILQFQNCGSGAPSSYLDSLNSSSTGTNTGSSCAGSYYVNTSNGYSNVPMNITEDSLGNISGTMQFPGYSTFTISGTCTSATGSSQGSISFVRSLSGTPTTSWSGTYVLNSLGQITMGGTFSSNLTWSAVQQ